MLKGFFLIFFCSFFINSSLGQDYILSGKVTNSVQKPLFFANIIAKPSNSNLKITYTTTDKQGNYKLTLKSNENYIISVSYLGYKTIDLKFINNINTTKNFILKATTNQLDEVIINHMPPVIIKKDTIIYNPQKFTTGTERKLKQVLKKLPGVEVDKNGTVTVMGKKVNKLLVDGKTFFSGGTKLGVENIPADAINAIEVLDNYNEVAFLKGLNDSDKMALNIKLKENKKQFVFGDIEAGSGDKERFILHPNIFYYSSKTNINFIGDLNNIGVKSFTFKEYLDFEGGIGKLFDDKNSYYKLENDEFAKFLQNENFINSQNKFGAINITHEISSNLNISAYSIFSNTKTNTKTETNNEYISNNLETFESRLTTGLSENTFVMAKVALDYEPTSKDDISYAGFLKTSNNSNNNFLTSETINNNINLNTYLKGTTITIKQNAEWHKKLARKHTASLTLNYHYDKNDPFSRWVTNQPILTSLIPLINDNEYNINQQKELQLHNFDLLFKHYWVLNRNNHLYTTFKNSSLKEHYTTYDYQKLTNNTINNFNSNDFGNDLSFKLNDVNIGLQHKFKIGIATFKYGVAAHNYNWKLNQNTTVKKTKTVWLPNFLGKIDFKKSEHLNFKYNLISTFTDAPNYANQFQLTRYNTIKRGNENLENELYHSARLWYTKFSLFKGLALSAGVNYIDKINTIQNQLQIDGINQFSMPFLTSNPNTTWGFNSNIRKSFGKITLKLKGNLSFSEYEQSINNVTKNNYSDTKRLGVELSTNFKKAPNIEIGFNKIYSNFSSINTSSNFSNENPYINLEYDFLKGFILMADYSKEIYLDNNNNKNRNEMANASLFYQKEDSAWGFKISGTNILNAKFNNRNSFSNFVISDNKTFIQPRIWLFTITYKI